MDKRPKIAIGLPSTGNIRIETATALISLIMKTKSHFKNNIDFALVYLIGSYIHENREIIVLQAQKEECTHLLFIDTDMYFPANSLIRLLERDKSIIGCDYNKRKMPLESMAIYDKRNYRKDEPFECEKLPTGLMLIKMSVFDKMKRPWFFYKIGDTDNDMLGEDFYMCEKAWEAGIKVYCEPTIFPQHIGTAVF